MIPSQPDRVGTTPERTILKRYAAGWAVVIAIAMIDAIWISSGTHSIVWHSLLPSCKGALLVLGIALAMRLMCRIPRYHALTRKLRYARVADTAAWLALLLLFVSAACILSYLCVSLNAPLVEHWLIAFDHALGFDWPAVYQWVVAHPNVSTVLEYAYESGQPQLIAIPVALGLFAKREELPAFFFLLAIASAYLLLISTPFPATSAFVHFNIADADARATVSDFALLRNGALHAISLTDAQGLVSMPSFHTALAMLFMYSSRKVRWLSYVAVPLNVVMILSTPTQGGHYLADVIAGVALFALSLVTYRAIVRERSMVTEPEGLSAGQGAA